MKHRASVRSWSYGLQAVALGGVLLWAVPAFSSIQEQGSSPGKGTPNHDDLLLPTHEGADLTRQVCGSCHSVAIFTALRRGRGGWESTVSDMISRGALVRNDESEAIVEYLATVFGPASPPLLDANTASQEELKKLPGLAPESLLKILDYRKKTGRLEDIAQLKVLLGTAEFEKAKGYVTVKK